MYYIKKRYDNQSSDRNKSNKMKANDPNGIRIKTIKELLPPNLKKNKKDASPHLIEDIDPKILFEKLQTFFYKDFKSAEDFIECKKILIEILNSKTITKTKYNTLYRNLYHSKN